MPLATDAQGNAVFLDGNEWKPAQIAEDGKGNRIAFDGNGWVPIAGQQQPPQQSPGMLAKALEPITSYPETYGQMNRESRAQVSRGVDQLTAAITGRELPPDQQPAWYNPAGVGNIAMGGIGYATSPINAALRTIIGKPIEENTGIPKEYTEFAASMALPVPKRLPVPASAKVAAPSTEELFAAADKGYEAARKSPFRASPTETTALAKSIADDLAQAGYRDYLTPKTFRALGEIKTAEPSSVGDLEGVRRALNKAAMDPAERDSARRAITMIDDYLSPRVPEIADARANYAAASRAETVQEATDKAARNAASANSGANIDNATRQQFKAILNSPKRSRGFSANELAQMETIVDGTYAGNAARFAGNFLGGGGGLGSLISGALTAGVAPVFGYGFKKLGNVITNQEVAKLDEMVRSRAPAAKAVGSSVHNWSQAAQSFETSPSVRGFAKLTVASRNLSTNLKDAGISVTPDNLLRSIQGPVKSAADNEQPEPVGVGHQ